MSCSKNRLMATSSMINTRLPANSSGARRGRHERRRDEALSAGDHSHWQMHGEGGALSRCAICADLPTDHIEQLSDNRQTQPAAFRAGLRHLPGRQGFEHNLHGFRCDTNAAVGYDDGEWQPRGRLCPACWAPDIARIGVANAVAEEIG